MCVHNTSSSSEALKGLHGVHLSFYSPQKVEENNASHHFPDGAVSIETNYGVSIQQIWKQRPMCFRFAQCNLQGDQNLQETVVNVLTSLPFVAIGLQTPRKNLNSTLYANSLIGVGVASGLYHCSRGKIRKIMRWVDYTMIAATTVCLSRALRREHPKLLMAASAFCLPFQPMMVSLVHTGMMEVAFARRASKKPELRTAHNLHALSSLLGGALFVADDCFPQTPYIHAAWHLAAALCVGTCNKLLE